MTDSFASEGFDLDAAANADGIIEIGMTSGSSRDGQKAGGADEELPDPMETAESHKQRGNDHFRNKEWKEAFEWYTRAIQATPGVTGEEMMTMKKAYEDEEAKRWREALNEYEKDRENGTEPQKRAEFEPPHHEFGEKLAVYHCNRAATSLQISQDVKEDATNTDGPPSAFEEKRPTPHHLGWAIRDCSIAILLNPKYTKAYIRRATAYERCQDTENALKDAETAYSHDRTNRAVGQQVDRLKKIEDERLEKLKTETLGKLKDLGNSILGNFGLSLDNFNAVQDPNTGSYSINFQNNS